MFTNMSLYSYQSLSLLLSECGSDLRAADRNGKWREQKV